MSWRESAREWEEKEEEGKGAAALSSSSSLATAAARWQTSIVLTTMEEKKCLKKSALTDLEIPSVMSTCERMHVTHMFEGLGRMDAPQRQQRLLLFLLLGEKND